MKSPLQPQSITLMGGPIDTRCSPTAINKLSKERPLDWFENNIVSQVPHYYPGAYRRVIPGFLMLAGFMNLNLETHTKAPRKLFNHMVRGDSESAEAHRIFYNEYRSVLDLPADYYLDSVRTAFQEHLLPRGLMTWRGERVDPSAIEKTAIMTVEGERDDISGVGQTYATHDICTRLSPDKRNHLLQKEVGHYGVFNGRRWREEIQPAIGAFIRQHHQD
jgi:poly(3-hydroxybutyrate) depolymerase